MTVPTIIENLLLQVELAGWGLSSEKLKGESETCIFSLIVRFVI